MCCEVCRAEPATLAVFAVIAAQFGALAPDLRRFSTQLDRVVLG